MVDLNGLVERIGIPDFPVILVASPVLMNVDVSAIWVVLYFAVVGTLSVVFTRSFLRSPFQWVRCWQERLGVSPRFSRAKS